MRTEVTAAKRVVVKVGSSSLTSAAGGIDPARIGQLVEVLAGARARGVEVVLVSSGAIAAGLAPLGMKRRPKALPAQQAAADLKDTATQAAQQVKAQGQDSAQKVKGTAQSAQQEVKGTAQSAQQNVKDESASEAGEVRDQAQQARQGS